MKLPALLLGFALVCCVCIAGYIHSKRRQEMHLNKQASFLDIKFRVTRDVLGEYEEQLTQSTSLLEKTKQEMEDLTKELSDIKSQTAKKKSEVDTCRGEMKQVEKEITVSKSEIKSDHNEFVKERERWANEVVQLKKAAIEPSKICAFIDKNSQEGRKLCGMKELPKPDEKLPEANQPKPQEPKPEEPKADQPKPEEPKAEQPKPQEPKAEQPKPQEPKPEEPKAKEPEVVIS